MHENRGTSRASIETVDLSTRASPTTPEGPMAACARCFTTGLVFLHPSQADWPPSSSYRGRIGFTIVLTVLTGVHYPLLAGNGLIKVLFPRQAAGSLIEANGRTVSRN